MKNFVLSEDKEVVELEKRIYEIQSEIAQRKVVAVEEAVEKFMVVKEDCVRVSFNGEKPMRISLDIFKKFVTAAIYLDNFRDMTISEGLIMFHFNSGRSTYYKEVSWEK